MKKYSLALIFFLFVFFSNNINAQQLPEQGEFLANTFLQNPAMTAPFYSGNIGATHRIFSTGFEGQPYTFSAFGQYPFEKMSVGGGIQRDVFGVWQQDVFQATYAYKLDLGVGRSPQLSLGIGAGLLNSSFNLTNVIAKDPSDPLTPDATNKNSLAIFSAGVYFTTIDKDYEDRSHFSIGLAGRYVLPNMELFYASNRNGKQKRVIHANAIISYIWSNENDYRFLEPSIWLDYTQQIQLLSPVFRLQGGDLSTIWGGIGYRWQGDFSAQIHFNLGNYLRNIPIALGINAIRPTTDVRKIGRGYGFIIQYLFEDL